MLAEGPLDDTTRHASVYQINSDTQSSYIIRAKAIPKMQLKAADT